MCVWGWVEAQVYTETTAGQDFSHLGENYLRILLPSTSHSSETFPIGVKPLDHPKIQPFPPFAEFFYKQYHRYFKSPSLRLPENLGDFTLSLAGTLWNRKRNTHFLTVSEMSKLARSPRHSVAPLSPPPSASEMFSHHDPYLWTDSFHGVDHNDASIANAHGCRDF